MIQDQHWLNIKKNFRDAIEDEHTPTEADMEDSIDSMWAGVGKSYT